MRHQRGQFGRRQTEAQVGAAANLLVAGQRFEFTVEPAGGFELPDLPGVHIEQAGRIGAAGSHQIVLGNVVGEHQAADLVGHRLEQVRCVPCARYVRASPANPPGS